MDSDASFKIATYERITWKSYIYIYVCVCVCVCECNNVLLA